MELEGKQDVFRSLQDTAEVLSLENHPAKQTVEVCDCKMCEVKSIVIKILRSGALFFQGLVEIPHHLIFFFFFFF
jgi:hypothetical protein